MSNYSIEYFNSQFKKSYEEAIYYKDHGNLKAAKDKFLEASNFLETLANHVDASLKDTYIERARRLKQIANSIDVNAEVKKVQANNNGSSNSQDSTTNDSDINQYVTFYSVDKLKFGFEGVIGLDEAKKAVTDYVINPILYPQYYNYDLIDNKGVLLEGPPGTGKTTFAKAVAKEIKQPFALINVANLVNAYIGETGKNIDKVFNYLREYTEEHKCGLTVFFDEFDEIAKKRDGDDKASAAAVPALLRNLDGMTQNKNFLIIANTNHKEMLDKAVLDRFRKLIYIPLPDKHSRKLLFTMKLEDIEEDFLYRLNFDEIAEASDTLSGRDITYICDDFKHFLGDAKRENTGNEIDINEKMLDLIRNRIDQKN